MLSYPDTRYGTKIKMTDSDGKDVPKTIRGQRFGSKFDSLRLITDSKVGNTDALGNPYPNGNPLFLPKPEELFQMDKPGIYEMEIQMQMFRYCGFIRPC